MTRPTIVALLFIFAACEGHAANLMPGTQLNLYDANGTMMGRIFSDDPEDEPGPSVDVLMKANERTFIATFSPSGLDGRVKLYFTSSDCSGIPYASESLSVGMIPRAYHALSGPPDTLYAFSSGERDIAVMSYRDETGCVVQSPPDHKSLLKGFRAGSLEGFVPPYSVR